MFCLYAEKNKLRVLEREPVTSGSVNVYEVRFEFSPDWDGMERVAVFKAGHESRSIQLGEENACNIPWEVLRKPGIMLSAGAFGVRDGNTVLPTIWASLGTILEGVTAGEDNRPPTPDIFASDHRKLTHRDAEGQHPIEAITGLDEISNRRVLEIWNGGITR